MIGMTKRKIAVSLPEEQVAAAQAAVAEGKSASVSAYVSDAIAAYEAKRGLDAYLEWAAATAGPPSEADYEWAEAQLARAFGKRREVG